MKKQAPIVVDAGLVRKRVRGSWTKISEKLSSNDMLKLSGGKTLVKKIQLQGSLKDFDLVTEMRLVPRTTTDAALKQKLIASETAHVSEPGTS